MGRGSQEFVEVFRRDAAKNEVRQSGVVKRQTSGTSGTALPKAARAEKQADASARPVKAAKVQLWPRPREEAKPKGCVTWTISHEMLVVVGVSLLVLLALSHAWGYTRGRRRAPGDAVAVADLDGAAARAKSGDQASLRITEDLRSAAGSGAKADELASLPYVYTLRVMGGLPRRNAIQVVNDLRNEGYGDAFYLYSKRNRSFTVNVGRFAGREDPGAIKLRETFENKIYKGKKGQFKKAYFVLLKKK